MGDVLRRDDAVGCVDACAVEGDTCFALVEVWQSVDGQHQRWRRTGNVDVQAWPACDVEQVVAWYMDGLDIVLL